MLQSVASVRPVVVCATVLLPYGLGQPGGRAKLRVETSVLSRGAASAVCPNHTTHAKEILCIMMG